MNAFWKLIGRLLLGSDDAAREKTTRRVVARYSRGNTSVQFGRYLNDRDIQKLRAEGDKAAKRLSKRVLARAD